MREPVEVQFVTDGILDIVHAVDISERGIALSLKTRVDPRMVGMQVDLVITLPEFAPFHAKGVIRRVSPSDCYVVGIRFLSIPPKGVESILAYVEHRLDTRSSARMRISG